MTEQYAHQRTQYRFREQQQGLAHQGNVMFELQCFHHLVSIHE